jgi:hypothetical protein
LHKSAQKLKKKCFVNIGTDAGGSVTDAGLRKKVLDEAFLRAGGPTNKKLIWCGLSVLYT